MVKYNGRPAPSIPHSIIVIVAPVDHRGCCSARLIVIDPITDSYDASPAYIYNLGDFDPSGVNAGEKIEQTLRELAPDADITFEPLAVSPEQIITDWNLPKRPTKKSDPRAKGFGAISVELDAIKPDRLLQLVRDAIERHLPPDQFHVLKVAEASGREIITRLVGELP